MKYPIRITNRARKDINRLNERDKEYIFNGIIEIEDHPFLGKLLMGKHKGKRSLRIGIYGIVYQVYKKMKITAILRVGHRRDVYR